MPKYYLLSENKKIKAVFLRIKEICCHYFMFHIMALNEYVIPDLKRGCYTNEPVFRVMT